METWKATEGAKYGIAIYNFEGKVSHSLALDIGDAVQIFESCAGWYRGCCLRNKAVKGIFPASFIQLKECIVENLGTPFEVIIPSGDAVVKEVTAVLREWLELWKGLFKRKQETKFSEMKKIMNNLIDIRQKILSGTLTQEVIDELKGKITSKIDFWNSQMELDLVPRLNGEVADVDQMSVVELYKIHNDSLKKSKNLERELSMPRSALSIVKAHRHILHAVKTFTCNTDDYLEVFISLVSGESGEFLSERFLLSLNKHVVPDVADTLGAAKTKTLFTDLGRKSFSADIFIVYQVVRTGEMHTIGELSVKKKANVNFRRPFACGVFNVQDNLFENNDYFDDDRTYVVPLHPCSNDTEFPNFHEMLIRKGSNKLPTTSVDNMSIEVSVKVFNGDREKVIKSNPLWIPPDIGITRKLGFPEIILPGDVRNDVYLTLDRGEFERGARTSAKSVEICVSVFLKDGAVLQDCIRAGTGCSPTIEYQSIVYHHNNFPKWNETIKLIIPPDIFQDCHVLFILKHCHTSTTLSNVREKTGKVFAFAFLKLLRADGTTVVDGNHQLVLYKTSLLDMKNPSKYLSSPSFVSELSWIENQQHLSSSTRNVKEAFFISTLTCSTKVTQNLNLVGLLKWRQQKSKIPDVLNGLTSVPGDEIMKFLQDIFDALFSILNDDTEQSGMLVFNNLIFIISLLLANKYQQFQAVLNSYIKHHFSAALAHRHLVALFNRYILETDDVLAMLKLAKTLEFILRFIMQSWALYIRTRPTTSNEEFKQSIRELFTRLNEVMGKTGDGWRGVQRNILSSLPNVYVELSSVFKDEELAEMLQDLFYSARPSYLISDKLNFLDGIITTSQLFHNADSRVTLMPLLLNCLHEQLLQKNELKTCAELLANLLTCLNNTTSGSVYDEVDQIAKALLQVVFQAVVTVDRNSPRAGRYVAILFALLKMMTEKHYESYLQSLETLKDLRDFLNKAFGVFANLLQRNIYPDDWFVMKIEGNFVILGAIQNFSQALAEQFLHQDAFDYQLWSTYFHLAISFVSHDILNLHKYSEAKRMKIIEKYGDMRHVMSVEIVTMWNSLGRLQSNFIPSMIAPFLKMTLVPEPVLRKETLPIFYDMMEIEMNNIGNIDKVEEEFVDKLDVFLSKNGMGDENYKELFAEILTEKIKEKNSALMEPGLSFVNSVTQLLERLLDYRNVISSREEYRDMKMTCIVNLMNYYDEKGKEEMYLRYVAKLYSLHHDADNYCEAGFALYLYASRLQFDSRSLKAEEDFPAQTEAERKEASYVKAIEHLDIAELWESGIRLCKTLIKYYQNEVFDFIKVSDMLETESRFFSNIINKLRTEPVYFRVGFYGKGFPTFLQNKQFIYRGKQLEKLSAFCFRIQNEYPEAEVLRHNNTLDEDILMSNNQYIQCCEVKPFIEHRVVPDYASKKISGYYEFNWIRKFWYSRPFHKGEIKTKSNEFATLWSEVITLTTESALPGILPWVPVVASQSTERSPIENAINTVQSKTRELESIVQDIEENESSNCKPLSMILSGIIDPAVNGGIANYQQAFFTPDYARTNPQRKNEVSRLEAALHEQASSLRCALIFHDSRISEDTRPFHENLLSNFNKMVNDMPGDTRKFILIQRKSSLPLPAVPQTSSEESASSERRISEAFDSTLQRKIKNLFAGRKFSSSVEDDEGDARSIGSPAMRQSTSLMSFSEESPEISHAASVPDLREARPKLPKKRAKRFIVGETGSPQFSPHNRGSFDSETLSINSSLTEIDEVDESWESQGRSSNSSSTDDLSRQTMQNRVQSEVGPPAFLKKKLMPSWSTGNSSEISRKIKKRQSNIFELASSGFFKTLTRPLRKLSKSLDDLDAIDGGEETKISDEAATCNSRSHEDNINTLTSDATAADNVFQDNGISNEGKIEKEEEDIPPPLMPRTYKERKNVDDVYDTLTLPSQSRPLYSDPASAVEYNDTRLRHYYANVARSNASSLASPAPETKTIYDEDDEEPYHVLTSSSVQRSNRTLRRDYPSSRDDGYDVLTEVRPGNRFNTENQSPYAVATMEENGLHVSSQQNDNTSNIGQVSQPSLVTSSQCSAEEKSRDSRTLDLNANKAEERLTGTPPVLPPKTSKKGLSNGTPISSVQQSTVTQAPAFAAPRTSSPDLQKSSPSNSPSCPRKKGPATLPKPRPGVTKL